MSDTVFAIILVTGIGLVAALGLALASRFMSVPVDKKAQDIEKILPGANCGACGFSGCSGYASAISKSNAPTNLCAVGGEKTAKEIADYLGISAEKAEKKVSCVMCSGCKDAALDKALYQGLDSCKSVKALFGSSKICRFGCIGFGDCVKVCDFNAIKVENGVARVSYENCVACGKCIDACPQKLIEFVPFSEKAVVRCSNTDKGGTTRKACTNGCIGCRMCERVCESGAVKVVDNRAVVDYSKCTGCMKCVEVCKVGCIGALLKDPVKKAE